MWNRSELRAKHHKANIMNGIVGITGKNAPIIPRPTKNRPAARKKLRLMRFLIDQPDLLWKRLEFSAI
ncbi:MAG: hypothetical protein A3G18_04740 [Rhodospirillales bacterium RIFCSPLOWO2_12_FULL_58_28]|nr:MAG: hypothetical protein A3H92_09530 [Rhodospirillales bacterium RIFCSPLOWO2_02_FULL_58_16]OHC76947.1 MAG: hypothetical protein A3G18_04740 [Rhodospirillales bacterium RIFCSPLOWO2_12_FULL_58_28]